MTRARASVSTRRHGRLRLMIQLGCCTAALAALQASRGAGEATLLVPLTAQARTALPALALDGGTSLVGPGLFPGSLVIRGRGEARDALLAHGVVALAVPFQGCVPAGATA